jgi:hypothetical protein
LLVVIEQEEKYTRREHFYAMATWRPAGRAGIIIIIIIIIMYLLFIDLVPFSKKLIVHTRSSLTQLLMLSLSTFGLFIIAIVMDFPRLSQSSEFLSLAPISDAGVCKAIKSLLNLLDLTISLVLS